MKKTKRASLAKETMEIVQQGWYVSATGKTVQIAPWVTAAKASTFIYGEGDLPRGDGLLPGDASASIEVTNESTFAALRRLHAEGATKLGCLNFASAKNPGGGFLNGAEAQEEALSRASALYECLWSAWDFYERNRRNASCLYLDLMIGSRRVPFFRDDDGTLLDEPLLVSVITAPAPNAGAIARNEPSRVDDIKPTLERRAQRVLHLAAQHGIKDLVLGAWGCGVFRNDPRMVAKAFADHLRPGASFDRVFRRVVFAIFDPTSSGPNLEAFRKEFA